MDLDVSVLGVDACVEVVIYRHQSSNDVRFNDQQKALRIEVCIESKALTFAVEISKRTRESRRT